MMNFFYAMIYENDSPSVRNILTLGLSILIICATMYDIVYGWGNYIAFINITLPSILGYRAFNYGVDSWLNSPKYQPTGTPPVIPTTIPGKGNNTNVR